MIDSFCLEPNKYRLQNIENFLLNILLTKEMLLVQKKGRQTVKKREALLLKYWNYRKILINRSRDFGIDLNAIRKTVFDAPERLVVLLTHNCQLRCPYCKVRKFPHSISENVLYKAIDLLFTSLSKDIQLQFFGGEPLLEFKRLKEGILYAERLNLTHKKNLSYLVTTNGIALTKEKVNFFKHYNVTVECSIDGEIEHQLRIKKNRTGEHLYKIALRNFSYLFKSGVPCYSISVFTPETVNNLFDSFEKLTMLGFRNLQINYGLGVYWNQKSIDTLFSQSKKIMKWVNTHKNISFINLTALRKEPVILNAELTVDCDGGVYLESGICLEEDFSAMKRKFFIADLHKISDINRYKTSDFENFYRVTKAYSEKNAFFREIILNNIVLGKLYDLLLKNHS